MADKEKDAADAQDAAARLSRDMVRLTERAQRLVAHTVERQFTDDGFEIPDRNVVAGIFQRVAQKMLENPGLVVEAQGSLWREYMSIWTNAARRMAGEEVQPTSQLPAGDRRFADEEWADNGFYDLVKQYYLATARWLQDTVRSVDLDPKLRHQADFYTRQYVDMMSPTNFALTNPKVMKEAIETNGESLRRGLENLLADLERGKGNLSIKQTKTEVFEVGVNLATTPGKVIFQNDLMQLIQYEPATEEVAKRPLLIMPPWINKYYILDLRPTNSLVKHLVEQGHTVFIVSWVNPDASLAHKTFEDYMIEGPLAALEAIEQATGERHVNMVGYCIGGTLLSATLAYMATVGDDRCAAATLLTALTDFENAGDLLVFIDDEQLALLDQHMERKGYLEARHMAQVFNMMRDNDLIWQYVVRNYLMGKEPPAFDLLYWNSDATRMPAMMHSFYLRKLYQQNLLIQPGGIQLKGVDIDLRNVKTPAYWLSTREDHIAPWRCTYTATQLFKGPRRFVLAASGHIAGVVNPPPGRKYGHWTGTRLPRKPDQWLEAAEWQEGSWWPDWVRWLARHSGGTVKARKPGDGKLRPIEDAPGSYVKVKAVD